MGLAANEAKPELVHSAYAISVCGVFEDGSSEPAPKGRGNLARNPGEGMCSPAVIVQPINYSIVLRGAHLPPCKGAM